MLTLVRPFRLVHALASAILAFACAGVVAQTSLPNEPMGTPEGAELLLPGIVLAKVEQGYQASRAGIRAGGVAGTFTRMLAWAVLSGAKET
jgi:hypothetical protein